VTINELRYAETSDGARIAYEFRAETGDEPPVLALHGVLVGTSNWVHQTLRVPEFRWLLPSMRGHGKSSPLTGPIDIETAALDMVAVLDAEGIDRALVIGNSLGATVALAMGMMDPDRCQGLMLVEPSVPSLVSDRARERLIKEAARTRELLERDDVDTALGEFVKPRLGENWKSKIGRRRLQEWRKNIQSAPVWLDAVVNFDPGVGPLASLQPPTLIMHGAETHSFYQDLTHAVADACPHRDLIAIPNAGHGAPVDNPEEFNRVLREFSQSLQSTE
jgi:pimeloyl-ACP methyl ester carboxylesterase